MVKNPPKCRKHGFDPWVGKIPWRRKWQPIPVFLPGKSRGPRSLAGYSPWRHKESDRTEDTQQHQQLLQEDSRRTSNVLFYWLAWIIGYLFINFHIFYVAICYDLMI